MAPYMLTLVFVGLALTSCRGPAPAHEEIDIQDAPKSVARTLTLQNGEILVDRAGRYDTKCPDGKPTRKADYPCRERHFNAFPVVPKGWQPQDPVPAWVTCGHALAECRFLFRGRSGPLTGPVNIRASRRAGRTSGWESAIGDAEARHGLRAAPNGPVVFLD
jgi:hypothetical protein